MLIKPLQKIDYIEGISHSKETFLNFILLNVQKHSFSSKKLKKNRKKTFESVLLWWYFRESCFRETLRKYLESSFHAIETKWLRDNLNFQWKKTFIGQFFFEISISKYPLKYWNINLIWSKKKFYSNFIRVDRQSFFFFIWQYSFDPFTAT